MESSIPLYDNVVEKRHHDLAIRSLCEELSKPECFIRLFYEKILKEMKQEARIMGFLSILICRSIRDLAKGNEDEPGLWPDETHAKLFKDNTQQATSTASAERRSHPRLVMKSDTIIVSNGNIGQVIDISNSGLAIKYTNLKSMPTEWNATVLNKTKNASTPYLPLKLVRKGKIDSSSPSSVKVQIVGARFHNPDKRLQNQIERFIHEVS